MLNIVIPMAGLGSRFVKQGYKDPKPLIMLDKKRMIEVVVNNLKPSVEHRFIFICQNKHLEDYSLRPRLMDLAPGAVVIGIDGLTEGAACTVLCAKDYINNDEPLMIANSDQWVDVDINKYLRVMEEQSLDGLIMTMKADDPKWSYAKVGKNGLVSDVVEKIVVSDEATVGIYNYRRGCDFVRMAEKMIDDRKMSNGEYYVAPVYTYMYKEDRASIGVFNIGTEGNGMYGLGIPSDLELFKTLGVYKKAIDF